MDELVKGTLIVAFAACFLGGGVLHFHAVRLSRKQDGLSRAQSDLHELPEFEVLGAEWGNEYDKRPVLNTIRSASRNGLVFHVCPDAFKEYDPASAHAAPGVDDKEISVTYRFPGWPQSTIRRRQGEWIVLPEDPILRKERDTAVTRATQVEALAHSLKDANRQLQTSVTTMQEKILEREAAYCGQVDRYNDMESELKAKGKENYDFYLEQVQLTNAANVRVKEVETENAILMLRRGPEVWLSFRATTFTVENRSKDHDASNISIDVIETKNYRAEPGRLSLLKFGSGPQLIHSAMFYKPQNERYIDIDLNEMLKDTTNEWSCALTFTLRYSDNWGTRFKRVGKLEVSRLLASADKLPDIVNGPIERDLDADAAL